MAATPPQNNRWPRAESTAFKNPRGAPATSAPRGRGRGPRRASAADDPPKTSAPPATPAAPSTPKASSSSRRSSRTVPPPVQTQPPPADSVPARPNNHSRRSRNQRKSSLTIHGPDPSSDSQRGKPRLPTVPPTAPIKDTPPHLRPPTPGAAPRTPRPDLRTEIATFVERVRASAMDHLRPSTPGSHIDWAGDDDDSLPDLDDWGLTISPIIVDGLRPLPDLAPDPKSPPNPLHPSLPAKPSTILAKSPPKSVAAATPMRFPPSNIPTDPECTKTTPVPNPDPIDELILSSGLAASIHAPKPTPATKDSTPHDPLSLHAHSAPPTIAAFPPSPSLPSVPSPSLHGSSHLNSSTSSLHAPSSRSPGPHPTHTRAHTVGRVPGGDPSPAMRSGNQAFSPTNTNVHARNHSSPSPSSWHGGNSYRPAHLARPKLTGGALALLNKTIGGGGAASKDIAAGVGAAGSPGNVGHAVGLSG